jgi:hypothetical protein
METTIKVKNEMLPEFEVLVGKIDKDIKNGENLSPALSFPDSIKKYLDNL